MTLPEITIWAVVFVVGLLSFMGKSPTALALVFAWAANTVVAAYTNDPLPIWFYPYTDIFVIAVIAFKRERSTTDYFVAAIFPVMWCVYVADMHDYHKFWVLYYLALIQLLASGGEAFLNFRRAEPAGKATEHKDIGPMRIVYGGGAGFG